MNLYKCIHMSWDFTGDCTRDHIARNMVLQTTWVSSATMWTLKRMPGISDVKGKRSQRPLGCVTMLCAILKQISNLKFKGTGASLVYCSVFEVDMEKHLNGVGEAIPWRCSTFCRVMM